MADFSFPSKHIKIQIHVHPPAHPATHPPRAPIQLFESHNITRKCDPPLAPRAAPSNAPQIKELNNLKNIPAISRDVNIYLFQKKLNVSCDFFRVISRVSNPLPTLSIIFPPKTHKKSPNQTLSAKNKEFIVRNKITRNSGLLAPKNANTTAKLNQMPRQDKEKNKNKNFEKTHPAPSLARFAPSPRPLRPARVPGLRSPLQYSRIVTDFWPFFGLFPGMDTRST